MFTLSDHADFDDLLFTVRTSGARRVYTTYGHAVPFAAILRDLGIDARPLAALGLDSHEEGAREVEPSPAAGDDLAQEVAALAESEARSAADVRAMLTDPAPPPMEDDSPEEAEP